jgi:hypothetical protein
MHFKFLTKKDAFDFCQLVDDGENINVTENNITTKYTHPVDIFDKYYVIADEVTRKYSDAEEFNPFAPKDFTPPTLYPYAVEIPEIYQWAFPEDMFVLSGFIIPLDTYQNSKVVNLAYFEWSEFRAELDSGNYEALKRSLMPLWDYVALQVTNGNEIVL